MLGNCVHSLTVGPRTRSGPRVRQGSSNETVSQGRLNERTSIDALVCGRWAVLCSCGLAWRMTRSRVADLGVPSGTRAAAPSRYPSSPARRTVRRAVVQARGAARNLNDELVRPSCLPAPRHLPWRWCFFPREHQHDGAPSRPRSRTRRLLAHRRSRPDVYRPGHHRDAGIVVDDALVKRTLMDRLLRRVLVGDAT